MNWLQTKGLGWWVAAVAALWGSALYSALQVHRISFSETWSHGICGPWGCGPPVESLIACHGFWLVFLALPTLIAGVGLSPPLLHRAGLIALVLGLAAVGGIVLWQIVWWLPEVSAEQRGYLLQRLLFSVVTLVEVPAVEVALAGLTGIFVAQVRNGAARARTRESSVSADCR